MAAIPDNLTTLTVSSIDSVSSSSNIAPNLSEPIPAVFVSDLNPILRVFELVTIGQVATLTSPGTGIETSKQYWRIS